MEVGAIVSEPEKEERRLGLIRRGLTVHAVCQGMWCQELLYQFGLFPSELSLRFSQGRGSDMLYVRGRFTEGSSGDSRRNISSVVFSS